MITPEIRALLAPGIMGPVNWERWDVRFEAPPMDGVSAFAVPHSLTRGGLAYVTRPRSLSPTLRVIGATIGNTVYLDMGQADLKTASGQALIAHEFRHVEQKEQMPDFDWVYDNYAQNTPSDRPWENPLERDAYKVEAKKFCALVAQGWPRGRWTPLGVTLWGCQ